MSTTRENYPRPDFVRSKLNWTSLNGSWDFLFDDDDVGLVEKWPQRGLPDSVTSQGSVGRSDASITQKIAALPEKLLKDNHFAQSSHSYRKQQITVPFVFQTPASGINDHNAHEILWYERIFSDIRQDQKHRLLLRFGAVDYEATVWVDGQYVGNHRGGHVPFEIDVTDAISNPSTRLTVRVRDSPSDLTQPRGKQYWAAKPESIFYTPSSGIWQSVWLESVPPTRIADGSHGTILRSNNIKEGKLFAQVAIDGSRAGRSYQIELQSSLQGVEVADTREELSSASPVNLKLDMRLPSPGELLPDFLKANSPGDERIWRDGLVLWSPEHPNLYDLTIRLFDQDSNLLDEVTTIVGMRSLDWTTGDGTYRLNDQPYFQALVLDQGYWPNSGMTPPSPDSLKADIELSKQMGFNGCRKHQKVEDPIFLYWADRLGYMVWGEMANAYEFNDQYVERFDQEWMEAIKRDINHPCLITWTPVNETWGYPALKDNIEQQNHIRALYYMTKTIDPSRSINDNCGWEHICTDLTTFHDYSDGPQLSETCKTMEGILGEKAGRPMFIAGAIAKEGAPVICTEFGGVNIAPSTSEPGGERDWGYTTASDSEDLLRRVEALVMGVVSGNHCCGFVYTQLTDIEQEVNGLYTFDRTAKLDPTKVKAIMDKAQQKYFDSVKFRQ